MNELGPLGTPEFKGDFTGGEPSIGETSILHNSGGSDLATQSPILPQSGSLVYSLSYLSFPVPKTH